ncbi:MAG: hypothetical protein CBB68_04440 [Rhodospirillaceae bacterium TMED8]|nr:MAG: hypothetical protein CBB68_04440 [Rhodospirillaceae bacterium TMED8]|tara:strand:+ start:2258 stop:2836 length:579 start_codon:yes stop_codon:yes gene_type:complete
MKMSDLERKSDKNEGSSIDVNERFRDLFKRCQKRLRDGSMTNVITVNVCSENQGGFESYLKIRDFDMTIDQPFGFEGGNKGPKPSEVLLASLAACQEVTWRLYAAANGIKLDGIRVELTGTQDLRGFLDVAKHVPAGFEEIAGTVYLESPASEEDICRLQEVVDAHCPVLDDLRRPVSVSLNVQRGSSSSKG